MSRLVALRAASTLQNVADILGVRPPMLAYILYSKSGPEKYQTFEIPKRSGGTRTIEAPNSRLKMVQRRLSDLLQDCREEIRIGQNRHDGGPKPDVVSHGFVRGRSIVTNARLHRNRRFVFNVDLENFFPSINFGRVRGFFIRDRDFSLHPTVATVLAQIACANGRLPQGSPCSPIIANLVAHILDVHLVQLATRNQCRYTRYADDLTFSTCRSAIPSRVARRAPDSPNLWVPGNELVHLVKMCGFTVNPQKTRMQYRTSRQVVTGLVVNKKLNVAADYRHRVRAMAHRLFTTGSFELYAIAKDEGNVTLTKAPGKLAQLHGMLGFIDSVDVHNRKVNPRANRQQTLSSKELTYRRFLLFKDFHVAARPVLVCEGKTDLIYITHAIRSLATEFPLLATVTARGEVTIGVRRYRFAESNTGRVLGISGGHGDLQRLMNAYREALTRFKAPGGEHPIVMIVDNDDAKGPILSTIKELTRVKPDPAAPFIHVIANLYVVLTPLTNDSETSAIESFFDEATLSTRLHGKSLSLKNDYSRVLHYGKADFAYQVVQAGAKAINFEGFRPLLANISLAIEAHSKRRAP